MARVLPAPSASVLLIGVDFCSNEFLKLSYASLLSIHTHMIITEGSFHSAYQRQQTDSKRCQLWALICELSQRAWISSRGLFGETGDTLTRDTDKQSALILIYCVLKYHGGGPENKSASSAVLKPYYLRFTFWRKKIETEFLIRTSSGTGVWALTELVLA